MSALQVLRQRPWAVSVLIFLGLFALYVASGTWRDTHFNAHVYLADAILRQEYGLRVPPTWFETVQHKGIFYFPYGVGPAVAMLPFVAVFGLAFKQALFSSALAAAGAVAWWQSLGHLGFAGGRRRWLLALLAVGCPFWFYAGQNGATWALMHTCTLFGLFVALAESLGRRRGWVVGLAFGLAVMTRQNVILALPLFSWLLWRERPAQPEPAGERCWRLVDFGLCLGGALAYIAYYNWVRFGDPMDNGYARIIQERVHPQWGIFHPNYFWTNFKAYFLSLPVPSSDPPWLDPTLDGFNIFLAMPALFIAACANWRDRLTQGSAATAAVLVGIYMFYHWTGFTQFGKRYFLDALPFVLLVVASGSQRLDEAVLRRAVLLGALVEFWGLLWWHFHDWH